MILYYISNKFAIRIHVALPCLLIFPEKTVRSRKSDTGPTQIVYPSVYKKKKRRVKDK